MQTPERKCCRRSACIVVAMLSAWLIAGCDVSKGSISEDVKRGLALGISVDKDKSAGTDLYFEVNLKNDQQLAIDLGETADIRGADMSWLLRTYALRNGEPFVTSGVADKIGPYKDFLFMGRGSLHLLRKSARPMMAADEFSWSIGPIALRRDGVYQIWCTFFVPARRKLRTEDLLWRRGRLVDGIPLPSNVLCVGVVDGSVVYAR